MDGFVLVKVCERREDTNFEHKNYYKILTLLRYGNEHSHSILHAILLPTSFPFLFFIYF